jgi:tetratricopeptide (TPR) repeat protein
MNNALPAPQIQPRSHLDEAKSRFGLSDPLEVIAKVAGDGNNEGVLLIFDELPPAVAADPVAVLFSLRALYSLGKKAQVEHILNGPAVNDGEFYLIKAKYLHGQGNIDQSLVFLEKALTLKSRNLDAEALHRDCLFYRAQCMSSRFDAAPSETNRKEALDTWYEVKTAVRKYPNHMYYGKAVSEMQRIGENSRP